MLRITWLVDAQRRLLCKMVEPRTPTHMGIIADTMRATLRDLAASDARLYRGLADEIATAPARPALPSDEIAAAIALLEAHGYTVLRDDVFAMAMSA